MSVKEWDWITFAVFVMFSFMERRKQEYMLVPIKRASQLSFVLVDFKAGLMSQNWELCPYFSSLCSCKFFWSSPGAGSRLCPPIKASMCYTKILKKKKCLNILFFQLCTQLNLSSPPQFLLEKFRWQNSPSGECYHLTGNISFPWERTLQVLWENCYWAINQ